MVIFGTLGGLRPKLPVIEKCGVFKSGSFHEKWNNPFIFSIPFLIEFSALVIFSLNFSLIPLITLSTVLLAVSNPSANHVFIPDNFPPVKLSINVSPVVNCPLIPSIVAATIPCKPPPFSSYADLILSNFDLTVSAATPMAFSKNPLTVSNPLCIISLNAEIFSDALMPTAPRAPLIVPKSPSANPPINDRIASNPLMKKFLRSSTAFFAKSIAPVKSPLNNATIILITFVANDARLDKALVSGVKAATIP